MTTEPNWLTIARSKIGTKETPGAANNPVIMGWGKKLGARILGMTYNADSVPWCGLFVAQVMSEAGFNLGEEGFNRMRVAVRAKAWADWGSNLRESVLTPGAILVFQREGGGHVGFYVGEDTTSYHVLGGNQSDAVNIMRIAKSRCVARRWPKNVPWIGGPVRLNTQGVPLSKNEG